MAVILGKPTLEEHECAGRRVTVVRDDLCCPFPGPNNSKMRGALELVLATDAKVLVSVDTSISRIGWGLGWMTNQLLERKHIDVCAKRGERDFYRRMARAWGSELCEVNGSFNSAMEAQAAKRLRGRAVAWLPRGVHSVHALHAHARLLRELPEDLFQGSVVVCASSGTIAAALRHAMTTIKARGTVHAVQSYRIGAVPRHAWELLQEGGAGGGGGLLFHDSGYAYKDRCRIRAPFPADLFLDAKAWEWLEGNVQSLPEPVTFWNVGGEWDPVTGLGKDLRGDGLVTAERISDFV